MSNLLELRSKWIEVNNLIKNIKRLIEKYPGNGKLRIELQELLIRRQKLTEELGDRHG